VAAWQSAPGRLGVTVTVTEPGGRASVFDYQWAWKAVS
jgi:hypothetical protein